MWGLANCTHYHLVFGVPKVVLSRASFCVETHERVGLLIPPGAGKSTLIRLLAGSEHPKEGVVVRDAGGWPLGYSGAFLATMTGEQNVQTIARFAGMRPSEASAFCFEFSDLGADFFRAVRFYTPAMRARLAFAMSFAIPARTYLADEKTSIGTEQFRARCIAALEERLQTAGLILVTSKPAQSADICDRHGVLSKGQITMCDSHDQAVALYAESLQEQGTELFDEDVMSFDLA